MPRSRFRRSASAPSRIQGGQTSRATKSKSNGVWHFCRPGNQHSVVMKYSTDAGRRLATFRSALPFKSPRPKMKRKQKQKRKVKTVAVSHGALAARDFDRLRVRFGTPPGERVFVTTKTPSPDSLEEAAALSSLDNLTLAAHPPPPPRPPPAAPPETETKTTDHHSPFFHAAGGVWYNHSTPADNTYESPSAYSVEESNRGADVVLSRVHSPRQRSLMQ